METQFEESPSLGMQSILLQLDLTGPALYRMLSYGSVEASYILQECAILTF